MSALMVFRGRDSAGFGGWRRRLGLLGGRRRNRRGRRARLKASDRFVWVGLAIVVLGLGWVGQAGWTLWRSGGSTTDLDLSAPPLSTGILAKKGVLAPPVARGRFEEAQLWVPAFDPATPRRLVEWIDERGERVASPADGGPRDALRLEYSLDEVLTEKVFEILRRGRVKRGHAIVIDPRSGRLLAYVSTDPEAFPPERAYPAASIVKVLAAAAMLEETEAGADAPCVYRGNKYRLNPRRLDRPRSGRKSGLEEALATSNNQCFSQWALHVLGEERLRATFERFGWLDRPAPGHEAGRLDEVETKLDLGRLGSGLDGMRVTPLHVAALTSILTDGRFVEPSWIDRIVDARGRSLQLLPRSPARRVLGPEEAAALREMMVATTTRGTAKSAFRSRRGRPLLGSLRVAGKTGNLTGRDPFGRYEWFVGLAPAEAPRIGVVVLQLQSNLWWKKSSELAANILRAAFCNPGGCRAESANRWTGDLGEDAAPLLVSELSRPLRWSRMGVAVEDLQGTDVRAAR